MNIKNKIIPLALSLFIGVGSLGIANAAIPGDYQFRMASWVNNDLNPMSMNTDRSSNSIDNTDISKTRDTNISKNKTNSNILYTSSDIVNQKNESTIKPSQTTPNNNNELYNQMIQMCNQLDHQQMMQNMTYEQMVEMEKAWHSSVVKQQKSVQQLNTQTPNQNQNSPRSQNPTRGWNYNCCW